MMLVLAVTGFVFIPLNYNASADFLEAANLQDPNPVPDAEFGRQVAISGDRAIVGAPFTDVGGNVEQGRAFIYERGMDGVWNEVLEINPSDAGANDEFGRCVAIDGDYAFVGAPKQMQGRVYVYQRVAGTWMQVDKLSSPTPQNGERFGTSCAILGNTAVITAQRFNGGAQSTGKASVFELNMGTWSEIQVLEASDRQATDRFGRSVDMYGDFVIIGASNANGSQGKAYIYDRMGGGMYTNEKILVPDDPEVTLQFGISVGIGSSPATGLVAIVGAPFAGPMGGTNGKAFIFRPDGSFVWSKTQTLEASDSSPDMFFGRSVSYSGEKALVGAPEFGQFLSGSLGSSGLEGKAYIFEWDGSTFLETQILTGSNGAPANGFGVGVYLSVNQAIVGASFAEEPVPSPPPVGAAYIYELSGNLLIGKSLSMERRDETIPNDQISSGINLFEFNGTGFPTGCGLDGTFFLESGMAENCDLLPGTYTVEEIVSPGYLLSGIVCSGAVSSSTDATSATIDLMSGETVVCEFFNAELFELTASTSGLGGGTVTAPAGTGDGINCGDGNMNCTEEYLSSSLVNVTANPDMDSDFVAWTGDCAAANPSPMAAITMDAAKSCDAEFAVKQFNLDVVIDPAGTGVGTVEYMPGGAVCPGDCSETYDVNTMITLIPTPGLDSAFAGWSGPADCSDGLVTLTSDITCTATFNLDEFDVTISKAGTGSGVVTASGIDCGADCTETYANGTTVTLVALADPTSIFVGYTGDPDCLDGELTVTSDINCVATFDLNAYQVTVNLAGTGTGVVTAPGIDCGVDCTEFYTVGTVVNLIPTPGPNSVFAGFTGDLDCRNGEISVITDINCTAVFNSTSLLINTVVPGLAGGDTINTISAEQATPAGKVAFIWGLQAGTTVIGGQTCNGLVLDIKNPRLLAIVNADGSGLAEYKFTIPFLGTSPILIRTEAVDVETCRSSKDISNIIRNE